MLHITCILNKRTILACCVNLVFLYNMFSCAGNQLFIWAFAIKRKSCEANERTKEPILINPSPILFWMKIFTPFIFIFYFSFPEQFLTPIFFLIPREHSLATFAEGKYIYIYIPYESVSCPSHVKRTSKLSLYNMIMNL